MEKNEGFKRSYLLLFAYIIMIIVMGVGYWRIAIVSGGNDFSFNEDILLTEKVNKFKAKFDTYVKNEYIEVLFTSHSKNKTTLKMGDSKESALRYNYGSSGLQPISYEWANYYYEYWNSKGYNFISYDVGEGKRLIGTSDYIEVVIKAVNIPEDNIDRISSKQYVTLGIDYRSYLDSADEYYIYVNAEEFKNSLDWRREDILFYPVFEGKHLILNSVNYLQDEYEYVEKLESEFYEFELLDFLYFSAITATTLGYGDILPNSHTVRLLVMIETVLGLVLMGFFVALRFHELYGKSG